MNQYGAALGPFVGWVIGIGALCAALTGIAMFLKKQVWPFIQRMVKVTDLLDSLPAFMHEQDEFRANINVDIQKVKYQLAPNGGGSLVDATNRTEKMVANLTAGQVHVKRELAEAKRSWKSSDKKLDIHLKESTETLKTLNEAIEKLQPTTEEGSTNDNR